MADHILKVAPKSAKVVFENDMVSVIEMTMKKGQTIPMHSHNKGLSYSLNAARSGRRARTESRGWST